MMTLRKIKHWIKLKIFWFQERKYSKRRCIQCEGHVRLIRAVNAALIRAGKNPFAGYVGRFAECIDEMTREIKLGSTRKDGGRASKPKSKELWRWFAEVSQPDEKKEKGL